MLIVSKVIAIIADSSEKAEAFSDIDLHKYNCYETFLLK